jgi:hypothetical protein
MSTMTSEKIEKVLRAHTRAVILEAVQINNGIVANELSWKEVDTWLEEHKSLPTPDLEVSKMMASLQKRRGLKKKHFWCPQCGCVLDLATLPVSHEEYKKGNRTKKSCRGSCSQKPCSYVVFVEPTVEELMGLWQ